MKEENEKQKWETPEITDLDIDIDTEIGGATRLDGPSASSSIS